MSTAAPSRSPQPFSRYRPYTLQPSDPQDNPREQPQAKASPTNGEPPSPPRSRRDPSETPSVSLSMAFGGSAGGKWWDEELPAPPASPNSILDSFRKSGEGDRELLLSILGAKKAEEEASLGNHPEYPPVRFRRTWKVDSTCLWPVDWQ